MLKLGICNNFRQNLALKGLLGAINPAYGLNKVAQVFVENACDELKGSQHVFPFNHINWLNVVQVVEKELSCRIVFLLELQ